MEILPPARQLVLQRLKSAQQEGVQLYFNGVARLGLGNSPAIIPDAEFTELVQPTIILLEDRSPGSSYYQGVTNGDFEYELRPGYDFRPSLRSVREHADAVGARVIGCDLARHSIDEIIEQKGADIITLGNAIRALHHHIVHLLDSHQEMTDETYRSFTRLQEFVSQLTLDVQLDYGSIVPISEAILSAINDGGESVVSSLKASTNLVYSIGRAAWEVNQEREKAMFETITEHAGDGRILVALGFSHLYDTTYLMQEAQKTGVPFFRVNNVRGKDPFAFSSFLYPTNE